MADSKLTDLTEISVPALDDLAYLVDDPAGTPVSNKVSLARLMGLGGFLPGGRLTLTTGVPVTTADVATASTLYYTPYLHNRVRVWDGTRWLYKTFAEISLALVLTNGKNYDVFLDDDAATLVLSAAWTDDTTRANALGTQDSVPVLDSDKTKLWLGTIRASGTNTTEDSGGGTTTEVGGKRYVWNAYNRVPRHLAVMSTTDSWSYNSATIRQARGQAGNKVEYVCGLAADAVEATVVGRVYLDNASEQASNGVGVDSTSAYSGRYGTGFTGGAALIVLLPASYRGIPGLGYHYLSWLESATTGTVDFAGDDGGSSSCGLTALVMG